MKTRIVHAKQCVARGSPATSDLLSRVATALFTRQRHKGMCIFIQCLVQPSRYVAEQPKVICRPAMTPSIAPPAPAPAESIFTDTSAAYRPLLEDLQKIRDVEVKSKHRARNNIKDRQTLEKEKSELDKCREEVEQHLAAAQTARQDAEKLKNDFAARDIAFKGALEFLSFTHRRQMWKDFVIAMMSVGCFVLVVDSQYSIFSRGLRFFGL